jgi:ribose 1,5-bisphosphate isomerase
MTGTREERSGVEARTDWPDLTREVYDQIRTYRIVGASACVDAMTDALEALAGAVRECGGDVRAAVSDAGAAFRALKPNTAMYENVVRWLAGGDEVSERAEALRDYRHRARQRIAADGAALVVDHGGALVHDYSSSVIAILREAGRTASVDVVVTAGEPIGQGPRVAREVLAAGHRVTFVPDGSIARHVRRAGLVLTGVETIFGDGSLANTVGTYPISLVARELDVPLFGATECLKVHPSIERASLVDLTARLLHPWPLAEGLPDGVAVDTKVLDLTPPDCVAGYVTEQGLMPPDAIAAGLERVFSTLAGCQR